MADDDAPTGDGDEAKRDEAQDGGGAEDGGAEDGGAEDGGADDGGADDGGVDDGGNAEQAPQMLGDMDHDRDGATEPLGVDDDLGGEKPSRNVRFRPGRRGDRGH